MRKTFLMLPLMLLGSVAQAENFYDSKPLGEQQLAKCSEAKLEKYFYDLGHVALYRQDCGGQDALTDAPVYLEFAYDREFAGEDFVESANKLIKRNVPEEAFNRIEADLNTFNAGYRSIEAGDRYAIAYSDITGLNLLLNDEQLISSANPELAELYFTIWFGDKPFSDKLKNRLFEP